MLLVTTGASGLRFNSHYSAYFDIDDPTLVAHNAISKRHSRHDSVLVVLHSTGGVILEPANYRLLESLGDALARLPYATASFSIANLDILGETVLDDGTAIPTPAQLRAHDRAIGLLVSAR